jgi:hypothetical protein
MAMASIGAVERFMWIRLVPSHGRRTGKEIGRMTKVMERMKMSRVTIEKRVIIYELNEDYSTRDWSLVGSTDRCIHLTARERDWQRSQQRG